MLPNRLVAFDSVEEARLRHEKSTKDPRSRSMKPVKWAEGVDVPPRIRNRLEPLCAGSQTRPARSLRKRSELVVVLKRKASELERPLRQPNGSHGANCKRTERQQAAAIVATVPQSQSQGEKATHNG